MCHRAPAVLLRVRLRYTRTRAMSLRGFVPLRNRVAIEIQHDTGERWLSPINQREFTNLHHLPSFMTRDRVNV